MPIVRTIVAPNVVIVPAAPMVTTAPAVLPNGLLAVIVVAVTWDLALAARDQLFYRMVLASLDKLPLTPNPNACVTQLKGTQRRN